MKKGYCKSTGNVLVEVDERYFRPTEVDLLLGNPTKARDILGWEHKTTARDLARENGSGRFRSDENFTSYERTLMGFNLAGRRVFVAGHRGMVGSAIARRLEIENCEILIAGRNRLDLTDQAATRAWIG